MKKKSFLTVLILILLASGAIWLWQKRETKKPSVLKKFCQQDSDCGWGTVQGDPLKYDCILGGDAVQLADYQCVCNQNYVRPKCEKTQIFTEVVITTDKREYEQGEIVKIAVRNNLNEMIYLVSCDSYYPEMKQNGAWRRTFRKECDSILIEDEINSEEIKILQECETGPEEEPFLPWKFYPAAYRVVLRYYLGCIDKDPSHCLNYKIIYSNEFRIKEEESKEREVTEIVGRPRLAGYEPFVLLAFETEEGVNYGLTGEKQQIAELRELASGGGEPKVEIKGYRDEKEKLIEVINYRIIK